MAVSICIPTYKRPELLLECLRSVFASGVRPLELLISDDAHDAALAARLEALTPPAGVTLRYVANARGRRQAANVHNAFAAATHEFLVLMHDDDYFLLGGFDALWRAWRDTEDGVDAVFGRQRVVDHAGRFLPTHTAKWMKQFHRLEPGPVPSNLWSALMQQFPMNGMMLRRSVALAAGVPPEDEVGHHTDLHFGIRYAQTTTRPFLLIADEVSAYRLSSQSIARSGGVYELDGHLNYAALERLAPRDEWERLGRRYALDGAAGRAVLALVAHGRPRRALALFARHALRMRIPAGTRLKLLVLLTGSLLGLRWSELTLRRRRLGLPAPGALLSFGRKRPDPHS